MSMEANKIFAAILVAGIIAYFAGIGARVLVHAPELEQDAYEIEAAEAETAAAPGQPAGPEPIADLLATADSARGAQLARVCAACHTFDKGGANGVGPNLHGVVGRAKAAVPGFAYSAAMKEAGGNWTPEDLNAFLWKPRQTVPGTKMVYVGMKKPEDRAAIIRWLSEQK